MSWVQALFGTTASASSNDMLLDFQNIQSQLQNIQSQEMQYSQAAMMNAYAQQRVMQEPQGLHSKPKELVSKPKEPPKESAVAWLDRRVSEMRVRL